MQDYTNFSVEDFLVEESFQQYCLGKSEEWIEYWNHVLETQPEIQGHFQEAVELFRLLNGNQGSLHEQKRRLLQDIEREDSHIMPAKVRSLRTGWWAAAAVVVIFASVIWFFQQEQNPGDTATANHLNQRIEPGSEKAVLTLGDGRTVLLDSSNTGKVIQQNGVQILQSKGQLSYDIGKPSTEIEYNTISTPRGGQYHLVLSDGSKLWLNAASSVTFPTVFSATERKLTVSGEVYLEVAHNALRPFKVSVNESTIEVLGTSFNVNAYDDEDVMTTTLMEGRIKLTSGNENSILMPGEQAVTGLPGAGIQIKKGINVEEVMAWKNGFFYFDNENVQTIMKKIARWYDVDIAYEGSMPHRRFNGKIYRDADISQVIDILEEGGLNMDISGKKIIVKNK